MMRDGDEVPQEWRMHRQESTGVLVIESTTGI
jgi:hypothetical protein